jgi:hypothetical protein
MDFNRPALWSSGQSLWLLLMRSWVQILVVPWGFFLEGEDLHGDHGLGSLVKLRFNTPPGTYNHTSPSTSLGQRNCALWASQPQKSITFRPQPGGETTKSIRDMWWHWPKKTMDFKQKLQGFSYRGVIQTYWITVLCLLSTKSPWRWPDDWPKHGDDNSRKVHQ